MTNVIKMLLGNNDDEAGKKQMKDFKKRAAEIKMDASEKLLILHYLGILDTVNHLTNVKVAAILAYVFETNSENIRKHLSSLREIQTEGHLKKILAIFEQIEHQTAVEAIKADLARLTKSKRSKGDE